jgi:AcrR family transcriptional regulator
MARPRTVPDEAILAGAAAAVADFGPNDVTLAQIGERVGLSAATLLQRFGSKRGLLLALARRGADALPAHLSAARSAEQPVEALIEAYAAIAAQVRSSTEFANHLSFLLLDLSDPEFREITRDYTLAVETAISTVLRAGGVTGPGTDGLARAVHAAYNGALITWGMAGDGSPPAGHVRTQLRHVLRPWLAKRA